MSDALPTPLTRAEEYLAKAIDRVRALAPAGEEMVLLVQERCPALMARTDRTYDGQKQHLHDEEDPFEENIDYHADFHRLAAFSRTYPALSLCLVAWQGSIGAVMPEGCTDLEGIPGTSDGFDCPAPSAGAAFRSLGEGLEYGVGEEGGSMRLRAPETGAVLKTAPRAGQIVYRTENPPAEDAQTVQKVAVQRKKAVKSVGSAGKTAKKGEKDGK